ncbi:phosphotransferase [Mycoplasma iguanae]|uniref:Phosphotransferase n=1 Tax=Mycoplasma iguanae TaxID=292461 RepID=A0ABY5RAN3_9MOLU|nr:phosphotransferase [Mycoplasma iguanae]UVD81675.1 phosphotransferase [Mycoplasma iguanae]
MKLELVKQIFPIKIYQQLTDIIFIYEGLHNYTFKAKFKKMDVQLRIIKAQWVNHENEIIYIKNNSNFLYVDEKGNYIKKWFDGDTLENMKITEIIARDIIKTVQKFHQQNNYKNIKIFDWHVLEIKDKKFLQFREKYKNLPLVLSHNDLRLKNMIKTDLNEIVLIDFEWIRYNFAYFDFAHLHLYCNISKKIILKYTQLDAQILNDFIYMVSVFNKHWTENNNQTL